MAEQFYWIGSTGPFRYDDESPVNDWEDKFGTGATPPMQAPIVTTGQLTVKTAPTEDNDVLRWEDIAGEGFCIGPTPAVSLVGSLAAFQDTGGRLLGAGLIQLDAAGSLYVPAGQSIYIGGVAIGIGSGDVVGPASSTLGAIAAYGDTTGKLLVNTGVGVDSFGSINIPAGEEYQIGGVAIGTGSGDVSGPATSTVGAIAAWGDTTGTTLLNSGVALDSFGSINIPAGQTYQIGGVPLVPGTGDVVGPASSTTGAIAAYGSTSGKLLVNTGIGIDSFGSINIPAGQTYQIGGVAIGTGAGDVVGPASATSYALAVWSGTSGKLLQNSGIGTDSYGSINIPAGQTYRIGGVAIGTGSGNVTGAATTTVGAIAAWGNTGGTSLLNSGVALDSYGSINIPAGQTYQIGGVAIGTGAGDVVGPGSATSSAIATFNGTSGKLIQNNSGATISSSYINCSGYKVSGTQVVGSRKSSISTWSAYTSLTCPNDGTGHVDITTFNNYIQNLNVANSNLQTAVNTIISRLQSHGLIY